MIEIGVHPDMPTAMICHSTESGQFMACSRDEVMELLNAVKRGEYDNRLAQLSGEPYGAAGVEVKPVRPLGV